VQIEFTGPKHHPGAYIISRSPQAIGFYRSHPVSGKKIIL
jgi:hypothetical protein